MSDRFEQAQVVVPLRVHSGPDFVRLETRLRNGIDHRLNFTFVGEVRIEPVLPERFGQDQRGSVVYVSRRIGGWPYLPLPDSEYPICPT